MRAWSVRKLRQQCRRAFAVSYVTEQNLQIRYPADRSAVTTHYSSVELTPEAFAIESRPVRPTPRIPRLVCVGSVEQMYKGVDTLLDAVADLSAAGTEVRLVHVGDGRHSSQLQQRATELGVADRVRFAGAVPTGAAVRSLLDNADLFVLPSRAEGLPRALIEAMARALPAIGSTAGGIPELLPETALVPPDDPVALASAIKELLSDPEAMASESARNLTRSLAFSAARLSARRDAFYRTVRAESQRRAPVPFL
jgi:glycosyltransferase involved in cell wall biosynthesis